MVEKIIPNPLYRCEVCHTKFTEEKKAVECENQPLIGEPAKKGLILEIRKYPNIMINSNLSDTHHRSYEFLDIYDLDSLKDAKKNKDKVAFYPNKKIYNSSFLSVLTAEGLGAKFLEEKEFKDLTKFLHENKEFMHQLWSELNANNISKFYRTDEKFLQSLRQI